MVEYKEVFELINLEVKDWFYGDDEAIKNSAKYKNFFNIILPTLQHWWIMSIWRLIDPPFFKNDISKKNLSIYYILEEIEDESLKLKIKSYLTQEKKFIKSIKKIRNTILAHNNIGENNTIINAWIESFFENINETILDIKKIYPHLKDCNNLNLEYTEKLCESWVKDIFEVIT
jgi:hypothetical protein